MSAVERRPAPVLSRGSLPNREASGARSLGELAGAIASADTMLSGETLRSQIRFGRYDLLERVGRGGMGEVFRAYDRELMEEVALKLLCDVPGSGADGLAMFHREVRLARRISHRNVARTYEFGVVDGTPYLTMEFVRGERLDERLRRFGRLSETDALGIVGDLCLGLEAAHSAGVIHRDIKPDNVMLAHDGRVVITDFGVARQLGDQVTHSNGMAGTPTYMAPEQVTGGSITPATDVFAVAIVLYELVTGRAPWVAEGAYATALARLFKPADDPRTLVPVLSSSLAELLLRGLSTADERRFSTAAELHAAVLAVASPSPSSRATPVSSRATSAAPLKQPSVVVLPFSTRSEEDRLVAEGLAEDLAGELSRMRGLRVLSPRQAARYDWDDPKTAGAELGAELVVEGSLRRAQDLLRLNARLLRLSDGSALWSQRIDCARDSILSLQGRLAKQISKTLRLELPSELPGRPEVATEAMDRYLEGRAAYHSYDPEWLRRGQDLIEQARTQRPDDPLLLSLESLVLARRWMVMSRPEPRVIEQAAQFAHRALIQNDALGEAHLALGSVEYVRGHAASAARSLRSALVRAPALGEAHELLGFVLLEAGRVDDGLSRLEVARRFSPDSRFGVWTLARTHELLGHTDKASQLLQEARRTSAAPRERLFQVVRLSTWRHVEGLPTGTRGELESWQPRDAEERELKWFIRTLLDLHFGGSASSALYRPFVDRLLEMAQRPGSPHQTHLYYQLIAEVCVRRGDAEGALLAVERLAQLGLYEGPWLNGCPLLEPLRGEGRFRVVERAAREHASALARELGFTQ